MNFLTNTAQTTMTSLEIAELTGKNHADVLRDIRTMLENIGVGVSSFAESYKNTQNKEQPMFRLPYEETVCLLTGYDAKARMAVIKRWQELEKPKQKTRVELARENLALEVELEAQALVIEHQAHKLDESSKWATVKRMEAQHKLKFNWRELKTYSERNGYETPKIADANYPTGVNTYHEDVWMEVYQVEILPQNTI